MIIIFLVLSLIAPINASFLAPLDKYTEVAGGNAISVDEWMEEPPSPIGSPQTLQEVAGGNAISVDELMEEAPSPIGSPQKLTEVAECNVIGVDELLEELAHRVGVPKIPYVHPQIPDKRNPRDLITVYLQGEESAVRRLTVFDPTNRLMNHKEFTPDIYIDSSHRVGFYEVYGRVAICMKHQPEAPGLEIASNLLYMVVCYANSHVAPIDTIYPSTIVIVMNGTVFSVSRYIDGDNLQEVLNTRKSLKKYCFNSPQISARIQWSILTNPEDLRPLNCILNSGGNGEECDVVGIDGERSFGNSYREVGGTVIRSHSFLYCFPQMHYPIPKKSFFIPFNAMLLWLVKMKQEHAYQTNLRMHVKRGNKSILGVPISDLRLREMYDKMIIIALYMANGGTLMDVLEHTNPDLATVYKEKKPKSIVVPFCKTVFSPNLRYNFPG